MTASTHLRRILSLSLSGALAFVFTTFFASSASAQALDFTVSNVSCAAPGCPGFQFGAAIGTVNFFFTPSGGSSTGYTFSITPGFSNVPGLRVRNRPYPMPTNFPAAATGGLMGVLNTLTGSPFATSIRLTDSTGAFVDKAFTLTVTDLQILTNPTIPRPIVGVPYDLPLTAFGLVGAPTWSAPGLANGLSLNAPGHEGHIWGTPVAAGNFNAVMNVTDNGNGNSRGVSFTIVVNPFDILGPLANNALPEATINAPYSATITAPNCVSCVFTITQGSVAGLTLATNGVLSGTPTITTSGTTLGITATGSNGVALENFLLKVNNAGVQPLQITSNPLITNTVGTSSNVSVFSFGGTAPYTVEVVDPANLPPGISLVPDGAAVSTTLTPGVPMLTGRAMVRGTYHFTLKVTDAVGVTAYRTFTWNASRLNFGYFNLPLVAGTLQTGQPYTQRLLGLGGSGTYKWTALGQLPGGLSLDPNTGTISGTLTDTSNLSTSIQLDDVNNPGSFFTSNVNFNITGPPGNTNVNINGLNNITTLSRGQGFSTNLTGSGGTGPYTITVNPGSTLPPGFALVSGNQSPTNGNPTLLGAAPQAGTFDFTLKVTDSTLPTPNVGVRTFRMVVTPLTIVTNSLKPGAVNAPYSQRVLAVGGTAPITYSLDAGFTMPPGLTLNAGGNIQGTPTQESSQTLTFVATDALGNRATRGITLTISNLAISNLGIAGDLLPPATSGEPYNYQFTCVTACPGATWTITNGFLPFGLNLASNGTISGTTFIGFPQSNEFSIFVTVTSGGRSVTRRFALDVKTAEPWLLSGAANPVLGDLLVGQATTVNLSTLIPIGGTPPYTFALAPGSSLPDGLRLVAGAGRVAPTFSPTNTLLVGAPTAANVYTFDLDISDSSMPVQTIRRTFTLRVSNIAITTGTTNGIPAPRVGQAYSFQFTTVGVAGTLPYTYEVDPATNAAGISNLPPGLTLTSGGLLSGTPTSSGVFTFRVVVHDSPAPFGAVGPNTFARFYTVTVADFVNGGPGGLFIGVGSASGAITTPNPDDTPVGVWAEPSFTLFRLNSPPVPATWSLVGGSLPPGLTLIGDQLRGRPSTAGVYVYKLRGTDNANPSQFAEHEYTMRITPMQVVNPALGVSFDRVSLPNGQVGAPYSFRFKVAGGTAPYTFSLPASPTFGSTPPGLTLDSAGVLSGTPTQSGTFFAGFIVQDSTGKQLVVGFQMMQLTIAPAGGQVPLIVEDELNAESPVPIGVDFGTSIFSRLDINVRMGVAPFTWSVAPGSNLPPGMAIVSGGGVVSDIIAGKATTPGTYSFTLNVVDGAGRMASTNYTNVRVTSLAISPLRLPTGVVGTPYNAALTLTGGTPPYGPMQLVDGSSISPGLTLSSSGVLSGTPTAPGNYLLAPIYSDSISMEYFIYRLTIDSATTAGEAKAVSLSPVAIDVSRPQGSPTAPIPLNIDITSGHPAFTAVITGIPGATLSATTGTTPAVLSVNLNTETLAPGVYHGMVGVKVNGTANVDEITPIIVTIGPPPVVQAIAVTPDTGTGVRQTFTATYSDSVGVTADLKRAMLRIGGTVNGCVVDYNAIANTVRLFDNAGVAGAPAVLGSGGTLSNSQCTLNLATSTATPAGNNLTLALDISFAGAFAGAQPIAMRAMSLSGPNTGFVAKGTWTVGLPAGGVQVVSVTPNAGNTATQLFQLAYSDAAGVIADLKVARVRFMAAGGGTMCMVDYNAMTNLVRLMGDDGVTWSPFTPFGAGSLNNSQCGLNLAASSAVRSGTDLTLNLALAFSHSFAGAKNIDMRANSNFGPTTGFVTKGTWTVP